MNPVARFPVVRTIALVLLLVAGGGVLRAAADPPGDPPALEPAPAVASEPLWEYRIAPSADLSTLSVRACFRSYVPKRLMVGTMQPLTHLKFAALPGGGGAGVALDADPRFAVPTGLAAGGCVDYVVATSSLTVRSEEGPRARRTPRTLTFRPADVLLQPALLPSGAVAACAFDLPEGQRVSAPWPTLADGRHLLDASAFALLSHVVVGRFDVETMTVAGTTLDVSFLDEGSGNARLAASREGLRRWLTAAAGAVAQPFGRFPRPRVQVVVNPVVGRGEDPVVFGSSWLGGGACVLLDLSTSAADAELPGEWVAIHEMTHLGMPPVERADAWLSEGFATYYQEVLRARAGFLSPKQAWQRIEEGFDRGRRGADRRPLSQESRDMHRNHAYLRVYWAGAALAMRLDVALRRGSGGARSLDDVMRLWIERGPRDRAMTADEAIALADAWAGGPVMSSLVRPALDSASFPDVSEAQRWLGVEPKDGVVDLVAGAPGAAQRERITAR
jgi:hypothetical protein